MRTQFIIFSVETTGGLYNTSNTRAIKELLERDGIPFKHIDGVYDGVTEASFLIDARYEKKALCYSNMFFQESILFVDRKRNAYLTYLDGMKTVKLDGKFQEVSIDETKDMTCFSRDAHTNKYYAVI